MSLSPALLLLPYLAAVIGFAVVGAFAIYRLLRFGTPSGSSWLVVLVFCAGTALVAAATLWQLAAIDWRSISAVNLSPGASIVPKL